MIHKIKNMSIVLLISLISYFLFLIEVVKYGWEGLLWIRFDYVSFIIIPSMFFIWLNFYFEKKITFWSNIKLIILYIVSFIAHLMLFYLLFVTGPTTIIFIENQIIMFFIRNKIIVLSLILLLLFLANITFLKIIKIRFSSLRNYIILFLSELTIILINFIVLFPINLLGIIPKDHVVIKSDLIFSFKTGSIIFAYIFYEGLMLILLKKKSLLLKA